jgi:hypothetical protein
VGAGECWNNQACPQVSQEHEEKAGSEMTVGPMLNQSRLQNPSEVLLHRLHPELLIPWGWGGA